MKQWLINNLGAYLGLLNNERDSCDNVKHNTGKTQVASSRSRRVLNTISDHGTGTRVGTLVVYSGASQVPMSLSSHRTHGRHRV